MINLLMLLAQIAIAPPIVRPTDEVIVIGHRAEKDLEACLARNCPPAQEVEASLKASVEQFTAGRYGDARHTLQRAIGRNKRHAAQLPGPVSSLYATLATVAEHEGQESLWQYASRSNVAVLRKNLGPTNRATLTQEIQFADDMLGLNMPREAEGIYKKVQQRGLSSGQPIIAAGATFRRAWLALMREQFREAERLADESVVIAGGNQPAMLELRDILRTRIAVHKGDEGAVDALAARLRQSTKRVPALLFAPSIADVNPPIDPSDRGNDDPVLWADIGYWIRPNGRTAEVEMLRTSGLGSWRSSIFKHVSARRYIPLDVEPTDPGIYQIDRFTVRAVFGSVPGSRIPKRIGPLTVHVVDLTQTDAISEARRLNTADMEPAQH
jgi:hypothetical protein